MLNRFAGSPAFQSPEASAGNKCQRKSQSLDPMLLVSEPEM